MSIFRRPRVSHAIINLEGVLIENLESVYKKAVDNTLKPYGRRCSWQLMKDVIERPNMQDGLDLIVKECQLSVPVETFVDEYVETLAEVAAKTTLQPGALDLLNHFRKLNIPMALYTSLTPDVFQLKTEKVADILDFFEFVVHQEDFGNQSLEEDFNPYTETIKRFRRKPKSNQVLIFVDNREDVRLAIEAGGRCVVVKPRRQCKTPICHSPWLEQLTEFKPEMFGLHRFKKLHS